MASRTAMPQSWDATRAPPPSTGQPQSLQLPQQANAPAQTTTPGPAPSSNGQQLQPGASAAGRGPSADPEAGPSEPARATNVDSLMDAVGASGVDLGAEEESLRATNERLHAQAMAAQASAQGSNPNAYTGVDRLRKQDFIDPGALAEVVKKVAAAFALKTLEPDTIPFIALATRHRLESLITASVAARDHRQSSSHFRPPPLTTPSARKRRRRDPLDPELDEPEDEDNEMEDLSDLPKQPAWDTLVYDDPERYLTVLERVDRDEERKKRRERMLRDQKEQEERELAEAMAAAEAAQRALESDGPGGGSGGSGGGSKKEEGGTPAEEKKAEPKGKGKAKDKDGAPATPSGKGGADSPALGKDGKPKKARPKKPKPGEAASGTSTPLPAGGSGVKNLSEDVRKRLTDQHALRSLGGQKFSWLNAGVGSPSPAGMGGFGTPLGLPKPKFATPSSLPPPSFAPLGNASGSATTSTSGLNPANNAPSTPAGPSRTDGFALDASAAASALTTSRLNVPQLHDAQRSQVAKEAWEAGHHIVELPDLLFALERERGMGVGRGSGKNSAVRGRAGVTRGGGKPALGSSQGR
ncbi:hypothetical protein BMF94_2880 [Rhodotorula taiwanensis]|uniref:Transcription initiation factor TFIID subunit 4 n=1 Tax=Rhodotorula taiwanensis TaxID=741276 RepID=A0A2S5BBE0_9BASI|nr:hypothetical protein BMF94_2880 [Rhodotorula taiwanensis]